MSALTLSSPGISTVASVHSRDLVVEMTSLKYFVSSPNKPGGIDIFVDHTNITF